ncbi:FkbM family methyltransferase [Micromonospora coxensis]|uniref:Methyltransferase, FkbM family n=1 Tax=Micromonospora coxensis TaxID=356852 RepID=A0A1C5JQK7_9ACTN|nr:FkbM family methyltransferase [Micromonospora coxensis]SCG72864.1 methyltransferase, FkbM family [Micromonospora coxensis]
MTSAQGALRRVYRASGIRRAHIVTIKTSLRLRSGRIRNDIGIVLYGDPSDDRAALLSRKGGALDRAAVRVWRHLATQLRPSVVIDVGANYGEVAFCTTYPNGARLHLVEANPAVLPWLRRTIDGCRDRYPSVRLHAGAASDRAGSARLHLTGHHSGTSSLATEGERGVTVETFRLDEHIELDQNDTVLFKVDVEGHEQAVLDGMSGLLKGRPFAGLCEVQNGDARFFDFLCGNFRVYLVQGHSETEVDARRLREAVAEGNADGWSRYTKDVVLRPL